MKNKFEIAKIVSSMLTIVAILGANSKCLVFVHEPKKPKSLDKYRIFK
ncbi:cyclic lactone autoinducer peptide [Enterococcus sp.]